jgi:hypothetical protein
LATLSPNPTTSRAGSQTPLQLRARAEKEKRLRDGRLEQPAPLWIPFPDKDDKPHPQRLALETDAEELFFGGGPGGGKTDLLIGLAATQHRSSIIFRRELAQMKGPEGIINRSQQIIPESRGKLNKADLVWSAIDSMRYIELAGVKNEDDKRKFQGRAHDLKGFDEITEFTESQYLYLIGWNRTRYPNQRCRIVATGNPPMSPEGQWVTRRWAAWLDPKHPNPADPGEIRWYAMINGEDKEVPDSRSFVLIDGKITYEFDEADYKAVEIISPKSRTFIPSSVEDNPILLASGYVGTLQRLPEPMRTIMLNPMKGFMMGLKDDLWQVIPTNWILLAQERWKKLEGKRPENVRLTRVGVDPSRGGEDEFSVCNNWEGFFELHVYSATDAPTGQAGAGLVANTIPEGQDPQINVDVIGIGSSVYDFLDLMYNYVVPINAAEKTTEYDKTQKYRFSNVRAAMYWLFREILDPASGQLVALPDDPTLASDLTAQRFRVTTRGIVLDSKEDIRQRIGRSPDRGDSLVLAAYMDETELESIYHGAV